MRGHQAWRTTQSRTSGRAGRPGPQGATAAPVVRPERSKQSPAVAQPGDGALSLVTPGQICTAACSLVALAGAASFADIVCFATTALSTAAAFFFVTRWGRLVIDQSHPTRLTKLAAGSRLYPIELVRVDP